jgi:DNA ligase-1
LFRLIKYLYIACALFFSFSAVATPPDLWLLKTYENQDISGWVMSEKLDGVRAYWDGENLLTRSGKIIHAPKWFVKKYPPFAIDGELWTKRGDFANILSIVNDKTPSDDWHKIKHYIFEVPNARGDLFARLEKVKPYVGNVITIIPQIKIIDKKHMLSFLQEIEHKGGEGIVVRDPSKEYIAKRTNSALKVRNFKDDECVVVGYTNGKGKYINMVGALECRFKDKIIKIGSGLSDDMRKNPPKIGSVITFKYQNLTKNGKPRFPVFLRIREL